MSSEQVRTLQKMGAIRQPGSRAIKAPETKRLLVIRVQFLGGPSMQLPDAAAKAKAEAFFSNLQKFYLENSYGIFTVTATVTNTVYTLSPVFNYNDESDADLIKLRTDTLTAASGLPFSSYDYIMIYHAGYGEEDSGVSSDLWSLFMPNAYTAGGKTFQGFTVVPELSRSGSSSLGVICHEFGHQLGLPDLYNTITGESTCGTWSVMDYPYGTDNTGINPPHLDPWSRNFLGYIDLANPDRVISGTTGSAALSAIETSQTTGYYKIPVEVGSANEYFISEYRRPDASRMIYDLAIPTTGLIIWHIDDTIALNSTRLNNNDINSGDPHLAIDLVEADGVETVPRGKKGDAFGQGDVFTSPQSNAFNQQLSGISLASISFAGDMGDFSLAKIIAAASVRITKTINYPNPAGKGYPHPRSGIVTTIVFNTERPPQELNLTIYNIAGEKVGSATKDKFAFKMAASTNYNWIYEYDWNGKNDFGEDVAPGIYFYRIKADAETKVGKLAIVR